jgi:hypothetical protein
MSAPSIPQEDQLNAMAEGSVYEMVCKYVQNPSRYDLKQYLSVNRRQLIDFLNTHPSKAQAYFDKQKNNQATHDVETIWKEGQDYCVASMDRGKARDVRCFRTLAEAVAEHVLVSYGMY